MYVLGMYDGFVKSCSPVFAVITGALERSIVSNLVLYISMDRTNIIIRHELHEMCVNWYYFITELLET